MDGTATETSNSTKLPSVTRNDQQQQADIVQITATNLIKNKRKNFNPRCSSLTDDNNIDNTQSVSTTPSSPPSDLSMRATNDERQSYNSINRVHNNIKTNNDSTSGISTKQIEFETMSMNWRKLLENHRQTSSNANIVSSEIDNSNNCYKIPNTNFTITKSSIVNSGLSSNNSNNNCSSASGLIKNERTTPDPQSKIEFAYNAFNAVQELLNVYGLSISPGDIVDAFKKQTVGPGCPQPPTPPRTPISSTIPTTSHHSNGIVGGTGSLWNSSGGSDSVQQQRNMINSDDDDDEIDGNDNIGVRSSTPFITLAPVSKLMSLSVSPTSHQQYNQQKNIKSHPVKHQQHQQ